MGNQRRSDPTYNEAIDKIHNGLVGRAYFAKAWYSNTRKSIGIGKQVPVPPQLDWSLWQGPAPRKPYKDNIHPYNWHWFKNWGTGEALNNGTHEVDICRWALGVDYPNTVSSAGGRYHFKDDWEFYDTLVTNFEYDDKLITWEGKCCQGMKYYNRDRGAVIMGTTGSILVEPGGYEIYNLKGEKTSEVKAPGKQVSSDLVGSDSMTDLHFANFIAAIRNGEKLHSPISAGNVAVTMLQLSNISWEVNRKLQIDSTDGKIQNDEDAMKMWGRQYENGWAPHL
jgi:predicted dehydrogenase